MEDVVNVVLLGATYPPEMMEYTRGLAQVGARVYGVGDTPRQALPPLAKRYLHDYLQVPKLMDEQDVIQRVLQWVKGLKIDRVESLWEALVLPAAALRELLNVPGMSRDEILKFRDKQIMKDTVKAAGLRVPHSRRIKTVADLEAAAKEMGYPIIVKPIDGAGSANTYRVNSDEQLEELLPALRDVPEMICEEFIDGEEFTFDTLCIDGEIVFMSVMQYFPRPLLQRTLEWVSPMQITVRDMHDPRIAGGIKLGKEVIKALGMKTGFTHMEWYLTSEGEAIFGEIGARPGGALVVDQMNYTCDVDLFKEWARVVCHGHFGSPTTRKYNVAAIFKRAQGQGNIAKIEGLDEYLVRHRPWICVNRISKIGTPRRNWRMTLLSDGYLIVRHPEWDRAHQLATEATNNIHLYAAY
ncbi:MAG TPA: hypothetical protein DCE42_31050 [Myxococcales bacterium]|nr:hypothetical protein [Deltaproteobacteria bacterium]MBU47974.1 hypothetical protein [Deltaproteobacteria bacterium]HAA59227.1 hypothetical protein [Myxococcales bacterium]|tara:strand:- start:3717 stop:4949 length:1233 start_codon:yes stop_codon:yes gene_type:complete